MCCIIERTQNLLKVRKLLRSVHAAATHINLKTFLVFRCLNHIRVQFHHWASAEEVLDQIKHNYWHCRPKWGSVLSDARVIFCWNSFVFWKGVMSLQWDFFFNFSPILCFLCNYQQVVIGFMPDKYRAQSEIIKLIQKFKHFIIYVSFYFEL